MSQHKRSIPPPLFLTVHVVFFSIWLLESPPQVSAQEYDQTLQNPTLEKRAQNIIRNLRCLVCQGQSLDQSEAYLARDLRQLIREKVRNGETDNAIYTYLVTRYGDYILQMPPVQANTLFLWLTPSLFLSIGLLCIVLYFRAQKNSIHLKNHVLKENDY